MVRDESDRQQRQIDVEKRLSRSREIIEQNRAQWQRWAELLEAAQERAWLRAEVRDVIAGAESLQELRELGISSELIRELGLGAAARRLPGGGRSGTHGARAPAEHQRGAVKRG